MGYVGLPAAVAFGGQGRVIGFDINEARIRALQQESDVNREIAAEEIAGADIHFTSDPTDVAQADFHIVAVPTPITDAKHPDTSMLLLASRILGGVIKHGDIIVYESTVYPGATEDECVPVLEQESGLTCGKDFFVGYSPERINPGDREHVFSNIRKVVSGQDDETLDIIASVYESVISAGVHRAPSIKVAEAAKVIENTQRDINIALMNELALIFNKLGIDTNDVLAAARTKWNFLPFTPGLVGGHCIGIDPYYLTYKATITGHIPDLITSSRNINNGMGAYIASQVIRGLIKTGQAVNGARVTILGLTFKENVADVRNTRVKDVIDGLRQYDVNVQVNDICAESEEVRSKLGIELVESNDITPGHAVVLCVPHRHYVDAGWPLVQSYLQDGAGFVYDVKGVLPREEIPDGILLARL